MKKVLMMVLVAGIATTANAATLSMQWDDGSQVKDMRVSDTATIEIYLELAAGQSVINYFGSTDATGAVSQTGVVAKPEGWASLSTDGAFGSPQQQVSVGSGGGTDPITGPGTFLIANQTVHLDDGMESDMIELTFNHGSLGILDPTGGAYTFAPDFAGLGTYYTYGDWGSEGVDGAPFGEAPRNPLMIHVVPEPASLALMGLGVFGFVRRRR